MKRSLMAAATVAVISADPVASEILIGSAAPITGQMAWHGEQHQRAVDMAVAELNMAGGLLGQTIEVVIADDYCNAEQAVAAAEKLVAARVVFVAGHSCSGAAIPASSVYEKAGIVMISPTATNRGSPTRGFVASSAWWPGTLCRAR